MTEAQEKETASLFRLLSISPGACPYGRKMRIETVFEMCFETEAENHSFVCFSFALQNR